MAATALSGCQVTGSPVWVSASAGPMPSGFSDARVWSAKVAWPTGGLAAAGLPATPKLVTEPAAQYSYVAGYGLVAVTGDVVVTATFTTGPTGARGPVTLQFRNAKTGQLLASKSLDAYDFEGIRADTLGGKPVVEVRYAPESDHNTGVNTVFDTSAHQLWTSAGQKVTSYSIGDGVWLLPATNALLSHGFLVRAHPGKGTWNDGASDDVTDTTGKIIMNVPYHRETIDPRNPATAEDINGLELINGYAVVTHSDLATYAGFSPPAQAGFRFVFYDLAQGGKKVAESPESELSLPENVHSSARPVAACGSKIVLSWEIGSIVNGQKDNAIRLAVADTRTGQTTSPVSVATRLPNTPPILWGMPDPTCSTMLVYDVRSDPVPAFAIDLAHGTVLWRMDRQDRYLSVDNGVTYALQARSQPAGNGNPYPTPLPGRLFSIAPDGSTSNTDLATAPLAFTADGSPVFAEMAQPTLCEPRMPSPTIPTSPYRGGQFGGPALPTPTRPATCDITVWVGRPSR